MDPIDFRTDQAFDQLTKYGTVFSEEFVEILELLSDINDDLYHNRLPSLTHANVEKIKVLLDKIVESTDSA